MGRPTYHCYRSSQVLEPALRVYGVRWVHVCILLEMYSLPGYLALALSVGVAERDWQAGVGAVWVGWWESSKPNQPDRKAFVSRVDERKKNSLGGGGRA
jgi:hypothetical protein